MKKLLLATCISFGIQNLVAMEGHFEKPKTEFVLPAKNQTFESYVGREQRDFSETFEIKTEEDLKQVVWWLFDSLDDNGFGLAKESIYIETLLKKIDNENILKGAFFKATKLGHEGFPEIFSSAVKILKKIKNENTIKDLFIFSIQQTKYNKLNSYQATKYILSLRGNNHSVITDPELVTLYQNNQNEELKQCIEHEVGENRMHLAPQIGLNNHHNFRRHEALFADRQRFLEEFKKVIHDPKWMALFPKTHQKAEEQFKNEFEKLENFLLKKEDFKHKTAELGLRLVMGDPDTPTYGSCKAKDYASVTRMDDPTKTTGLQLFVFLINICEKKKDKLNDDMVWNLFQEKFCKEDLWNLFKGEAEDIFKKEGIHLIKDLPDTINNDVKESEFINVLKKNGGLKTVKGIFSQLGKKQDDLTQEAYTNMIEMLFMLQRGHNQKFNDPTEKNRPRCPVGLWDDCLREIGIATGFNLAPNMTQIEKCIKN